jgi:hypothetical protein
MRVDQHAALDPAGHLPFRLQANHRGSNRIGVTQKLLVAKYRAKRGNLAATVVAVSAVSDEIPERRARFRVVRGNPRRIFPGVERRARISGPSGSPWTALGSRSVDSCSALNPSGPGFVVPWQARQSVAEGIVCCLPPPTSAAPRTPLSGASTASVPAASHT